MKSILCPAPFSLSVSEMPIPALAPKEALVKINRVGICGTDLHAFQGNQPFFSYPRILGHELSGVIKGKGNQVNGLKTGDQVTVIPYKHCGHCQACNAGQTNCCESISVFGVHEDGGMQEYISYPASLLIETNALTSEEAALVEPLAVGAHSIRRSQIKKDDLVLVQGCGPIGIGILMLAQYRGAKVIVLDVNPQRISYIKKHFNVDHAFNVMSGTEQSHLIELLKSRKADVVIDATGSASAIPSGIQYLRHGGKLVLVGIANTTIAFHHPSIHAKETSILCSRNATPDDFEYVIKAIKSGNLNMKAYVTRQVGAQEIVEGFSKWINPESSDIKVVTHWT